MKMLTIMDGQLMECNRHFTIMTVLPFMVTAVFEVGVELFSTLNLFIIEESISQSVEH